MAPGRQDGARCVVRAHGLYLGWGCGHGRQGISRERQAEGRARSPHPRPGPTPLTCPDPLAASRPHSPWGSSCHAWGLLLPRPIAVVSRGISNSRHSMLLSPKPCLPQGPRLGKSPRLLSPGSQTSSLDPHLLLSPPPQTLANPTDSTPWCWPLPTMTLSQATDMAAVRGTVAASLADSQLPSQRQMQSATLLEGNPSPDREAHTSPWPCTVRPPCFSHPSPPAFFPPPTLVPPDCPSDRWLHDSLSQCLCTCYFQCLDHSPLCPLVSSNSDRLIPFHPTDPSCPERQGQAIEGCGCPAEGLSLSCRTLWESPKGWEPLQRQDRRLPWLWEWGQQAAVSVLGASIIHTPLVAFHSVYPPDVRTLLGELRAFIHPHGKG